MNILFLLSWKYPTHNAATKRIKNYSDGLELLGNNIDIKDIVYKSNNPLMVKLIRFFYPFYALKNLSD